MSSSSTKERILDAAEQLFAERGYDGSSMRALTEHAQVNLAAVHYHFGSKAELFAAVFERHVGGINRERLALLEALENRESGDPSLEELLGALLAPALELAKRDEPGPRAFLRLMGRMHSLSGEHATAVRGVFEPVLARFSPALRRALPHLDAQGLSWRIFFMIGALCTTLADPHRLRATSDGRCDPDDTQELLVQLVTFASAGLRAPLAERPLARGGHG